MYEAGRVDLDRHGKRETTTFRRSLARRERTRPRTKKMDSHHLDPASSDPANNHGDYPSVDEGQNQLAVAFEISKLLNCGLDKETLSLCMGLLEQGVNPEALADVIIEIREREVGTGEGNENENKNGNGETDSSLRAPPGDVPGDQ